MDAELKAKWIAALRSGEYRQCRDALVKDGGFCCLGVLHTVVTGAPPIIDTWGMEQPKPLDIDLTHEEITDLANRNDGNKSHIAHSFAQIADYIEKNL